jgi:hypothetical protein
MNWFGSGFIPILIYASGIATEEEQNAILTENNLDILTESSDSILTE